MRFMWGTSLLVALPVLAAAQVLPPLELEFQDALVTEGREGESVSIGGRLLNLGDEKVELVRFGTPVAGLVLLQKHERDEHGMKSLKTLEGIGLEKDQAYDFIPGDVELKLVGLTQDLHPGDEIALLAQAKDGRSRTLRVKIIQGYGE